MSLPRLVAITSLVTAGLLIGSLWATAHPFVATEELGSCPDTSARVWQPSSLAYEFVRTGGHTEVVEPDLNQAYGCGITTRRAVLPVDLYILTILGFSLTMRLVLKLPAKREASQRQR